MMSMKDLQETQAKIIEEMEVLNVSVSKKKQSLESISNQISELKDIQDYGSLKFLHANLNTIIEKLAPKHKLPKPREIKLSTSSDTQMVASIPYGVGECNDNNPCNVTYCDRCTLLHLNLVLSRLLANYYSK